MSVALDKMIKYVSRKHMNVELCLVMFILGFILKASETASNKATLSFQETVKRGQRQAETLR
jgi:hypothetical protein